MSLEIGPLDCPKAYAKNSIINTVSKILFEKRLFASDVQHESFCV